MKKGSVVFYYKRGWTWIALVLSAGNSMAIWYVFLGFDNLFATVWIFISYAAPIVVIGAILLGIIDVYRGTYKSEISTQTKKNPAWIEMIAILKRIENNQKEKTNNDH